MSPFPHGGNSCDIDIARDVDHPPDVRIVLDTNVVVAGLRSPTGASAELLRRVRHRNGRLLLSVALLFEYEAVCCLPEHLAASELTAAEARQILDVLAAVAEPVEIRFLWRPQLRDAADEMVLETAINGRADALVTFNEKDFLPSATTFGLWVANPRRALERIAT